MPTVSFAAADGVTQAWSPMPLVFVTTQAGGWPGPCLPR